MQIEREGSGARISLDRGELHLMQRALEKASFIDIPRDEQPAVASFCTRALEALASLGA